MSVSTPRPTAIVRPVWAIFALPATLAHELTHVVASLPWARRVGVVVDPWSGRAAARIEWRQRAGSGARAFAAIAPVIAGSVAGIVALALWAANGGGVPSSSVALAKVAILTAWWVIYMTPSAGDGEVFWGGDDDD